MTATDPTQYIREDVIMEKASIELLFARNSLKFCTTSFLLKNVQNFRIITLILQALMKNGQLKNV